MRYLLAYNEELNIDGFKSFVKRYKKTDYISKSAIKKLDEIGISYKSFKELEFDLERTLDFLNRNNFEILKDILQYSLDEYTQFSIFSISTGICFESKPDGFWDKISGTLLLYSEENENITFPKTIDMFEEIIKYVEKLKLEKIKNAEENIKRGEMNRPGVNKFSSFDKEQLRKIKDANYYDDLKIYNIINLRFNIPYYDNNTYEVINNFKRSIEHDEIIGRYFRAIGFNYDNYSISIENFGTSVLFKIVINT